MQDHDEIADAEDLALSMSDLMAACLYVFIILLVVYAYLFRANYEDAPAIGQAISDVVARRSMAVEAVSDALARRGIRHDAEPGVGRITFDPSEISFASGAATVDAAHGRSVARIAAALAEGLRCFVGPSGVPALRGCSDGVGGSVTAVLLAGHTDNVPPGRRSSLDGNLALSVDRAVRLIDALEADPDLAALATAEGDPVLLALGAGARRPDIRHVEPTNEPRNRRITLDIVVAAPWVSF